MGGGGCPAHLYTPELPPSGAEPQSAPDTGFWPVPAVVTAVFILLVALVMFAWYRCHCSQQRREVGGPAPQFVRGGESWVGPPQAEVSLTVLHLLGLQERVGEHRSQRASPRQGPSRLWSRIQSQAPHPDPPCPSCKLSLSPGLPGGQHGRARGLHQGRNLEFLSQGSLLLRVPWGVGSTSSSFRTQARAGSVPGGGGVHVHACP